MRLCQAVLGKSDYQLGHTKVFLKDAHDLFLEQERDRVLTRKIIILQRSIKGWVYRRRFVRLRWAALIVQRQWRAYAQRRRYQKMKVGYMRLQALLRARVLSHRFRHLRGHIVGLQVCLLRLRLIIWRILTDWNTKWGELKMFLFPISYSEAVIK